MKRSLSITILLCCVGPASLATAEHIGVWRWLGMGWGPGYHSGAGTHHGHLHHYRGQPMAVPAWEESWPVAPDAAPPEIEPIPHAATLRGEISPAQQAVLRRESQRRATRTPENSTGPSINSYFQPSR